MANTISVSITSQTKGLQRGLNQAKGQLTGFQGVVQKTALGVGTLAKSFAAIYGVTKIGQFFGDSITEARDLNETMNKSNVIFGKSAGVMDKWGNSAAQNFGLSKNEALGLASSLGDMFLQLGFSEKETLKLSKGTVQLAADLGSFNNLDTVDVLDRISAAYRGEYDGLQKVIPNISAARVEKEAMILTGKENVKQLTAEDKAMAVNSIITKDSSRSNGDFAKTSGDLANKQKILSAKTKDLQAKLGQLLLPAMTKLTTAAVKLVDAIFKSGPKFKAAGAFIEKHSTAIKVAAGIITALFLPSIIASTVAFIANTASMLAMNAAWVIYGVTSRIMGTTLKVVAIGQWLLNAALSANPIGLVVIAIAALVGGLIYAYKNSETFRNIVNGVWAAVKAGVSSAINGIKSALSSIGGVIKNVINFFKELASGIKTKTTEAVNWVKSIPGKIKSALGNVGTMLKNAGSEIINGLWNGLKDKAKDMLGWVGGLGGKIKSLKGPLSYDKKMLTPEGAAIIAGLQRGMESATPALYKTVTGISRTLANTSFSLGASHMGASLSPAGAFVQSSSGSSTPIEINFYGPVVGESKAEIGKWVKDALDEWQRVSGR